MPTAGAEFLKDVIYDMYKTQIYKIFFVNNFFLVLLVRIVFEYQIYLRR